MSRIIGMGIPDLPIRFSDEFDNDYIDCINPDDDIIIDYTNAKEFEKGQFSK